MNCYAVIDTNVLVSALLAKNPKSATVQVMERFFAGKVIPVYSYLILKEYRDVLYRAKFSFATEQIESLMLAIEKYGVLVEPADLMLELPDKDDIPFYEVTMEKKDDNAYLVTGNTKHFPKEDFIVTPREFIEILDKMENAGNKSEG